MSEETNIMKEIFQQLVNRCDYESVVNYDCSKLWFNFRYGGTLISTISKCKDFFNGDNSDQGKDINKLFDDYGDSPAIVEKIDEMLQGINKYGIYK